MPACRFPIRALGAFVTVGFAVAICSAAPPTPVDLKGYYNLSLTNSPIGAGSLNGNNNLASLPAGTQSYASIPFDVSGMIQLTSHQAVLAGRNFPEKIDGIKVGSTCKRLHLLHGAGWNDVENTTIATLVLHYADGEKRELPIIYGKHVADWWENEDKPTDQNTTIAWTGVNRVSKMLGTSLHIYKTTFENPKPTAPIEKIDFISTKKQSAPFLLGLTVE